MASSEPLLALIHHQFGPYHVARARALRRIFPGTVRFIQLAASESIRAWRADGADDLAIETAVPGVLESISPRIVAAELEKTLERIRPDVVAISGYAHPAMRRAAVWARRRGARTILISDSQSRDWPRRPWREWLKRRWLTRNYDAAFVSGASAACYIESLGVPAHRIWRGYDVVDNDHFAVAARTARADLPRSRESLGLPPLFFLYVGRFAPEKNLATLIDAFSTASSHQELRDWSLVLVGGGPLEGDLRRRAAPLGDRVQFIPFQQLEDLPSYYGLAAAFVLPSLSEPWGLVVNEAMAAGLPVIVSSQCGCALDLVFPGLNGAIVDPHDLAGLATALVRMARDGESREAYGRASTQIIQNFSLETWSRALTGCSLPLREVVTKQVTAASEGSSHG